MTKSTCYRRIRYGWEEELKGVITQDLAPLPGYWRSGHLDAYSNLKVLFQHGRIKSKDEEMVDSEILSTKQNRDDSIDHAAAQPDGKEILRHSTNDR